MRLSAHTNSIIDLAVEDQMKLLVSNGFEGVMLFWSNDQFDTSKQAFPSLARNLGLHVDNIHIPFGGEDYLWQDNLAGDDYMKLVIKCIEDCYNHHIPTAVMHARGWQSQIPLNDLGLQRYQTILDRADKLDINLALENTSDTEVLDFLYSNMSSSRLKFCFDNGHANIYHKDENLIYKYADRLVAVHLTDNDGIDDLHLLPFDGTVDWQNLVQSLKGINHMNLSFEVGWQYRDEVKKYSHPGYIKELRSRADKLISLSK